MPAARVRDAIEAELDLGRALPGAQHPAELPARAVGRARLFGARHLRAARPRAVDAFTTIADHTQLMPASQAPRDRLSAARRQDQLRPAVLGLHLEHQSRGRPAAASAAARPGQGDHDQLSPLRFAGTALLSGRGLRDRDGSRRPASRGCRSTRRIACTARPATSRTRSRTLIGLCRRAAADPIIRTCNGQRLDGQRDRIDADDPVAGSRRPLAAGGCAAARPRVGVRARRGASAAKPAAGKPPVRPAERSASATIWPAGRRSIARLHQRRRSGYEKALAADPGLARADQPHLSDGGRAPAISTARARSGAEAS